MAFTPGSMNISPIQPIAESRTDIDITDLEKVDRVQSKRSVTAASSCVFWWLRTDRHSAL